MAPNVLIVEALAVTLVLSIADSLGLKRVIVEGDSLIVINTYLKNQQTECHLVSFVDFLATCQPLKFAKFKLNFNNMERIMWEFAHG